MVAGAHFKGGIGSAYVFGRNQGGADQWGQVKRLQASDGLGSDEFGFSVSVFGDTIMTGDVNEDGVVDVLISTYNTVHVFAGTKSGGIEIVTPLIAMRKSEIVRLGLDLGAPFDLTWTCYSREDRACGLCDSCVLRLRAFREAGSTDPLHYIPAPQMV